MLTKDALHDQKYSKNSNIVKHYNSSLYFKMLFILEFIFTFAAAITPVLHDPSEII